MTGAGFQVTFEPERLKLGRKCKVGSQAPRSIRPGAGIFSGVMVGDPLPEVLRASDVATVWMGRASEQVAVVRGRKGKELRGECWPSAEPFQSMVTLTSGWLFHPKPRALAVDGTCYAKASQVGPFQIRCRLAKVLPEPLFR